MIVADGPSAGAGGGARGARGARRRRDGRRPDRDRLDERAARPRRGDEHRAAPGDRRRSSILLDTSVEPTGDVVTPLVRALDDPTVAVAGGWGIVSTDLRKFEDAPAGDVDAIEGYLLAFRRADCRRARPARRAVPLLPEPRHLVEPRPARRRGGERAAPRGPPRRPARRPPRAPRLHEPPRRRARPAEQAQLLPDHRPLRLAAGPARPSGRGERAAGLTAGPARPPALRSPFGCASRIRPEDGPPSRPACR